MNEQASALRHLNLKFNVYEWEQALCVSHCWKLDWEPYTASSVSPMAIALENMLNGVVRGGVEWCWRDKMLIKLCKSGKNLCCAARGCWVLFGVIFTHQRSSVCVCMDAPKTFQPILLQYRYVCDGINKIAWWSSVCAYMYYTFTAYTAQSYSQNENTAVL